MAPVSSKPPQQWHCSACPKAFGRKGDLVRHKLLHAGHKPHVCSVCGKAFSQFSGLKTHKNIHSGGKPYICGYPNCQSSFGDPSSCARHRKETHLRTEPFKCTQTGCRTSIKRRSAFVLHLRLKHGVELSPDAIDAMAPPLLPAPVTFIETKTSCPSTPQHDVQTSFVPHNPELFIEADNFSAPPPYVAEEQQCPPSYHQTTTNRNSSYLTPSISSFDRLASPMTEYSSSCASSSHTSTPVLDFYSLGQNPLNLLVAQSLAPSRQETPYIWDLPQQWIYPQDLTKSYLPYDFPAFNIAPRERIFCSCSSCAARISI